MQILQEQISVMYMDVEYADIAGANICYVQILQEQISVMYMDVEYADIAGANICGDKRSECDHSWTGH
jgi:hypothetical protein